MVSDIWKILVPRVIALQSILLRDSLGRWKGISSLVVNLLLSIVGIVHLELLVVIFKRGICFDSVSLFIFGGDYLSWITCFMRGVEFIYKAIFILRAHILLKSCSDVAAHWFKSFNIILGSF